MSQFTTYEKLVELRRELSLRNRVYPEFVANGRLHKLDADRQVGILREVIADYEQLAALDEPELFGEPSLEGGDGSEARRRQ